MKLNIYQAVVLWLSAPVAMLTAVSAQTRTLPAPAKTVFKCSVDGKTVYSDEPCIGAQRVDVEATRGVNKTTGKELTGPDVAREKRREQFAESIKPLTGLNTEQFNTYERRFNLPATAKSECEYLDARIAQMESEERAASVETKANIQNNLLLLRKRFRALTC